MKRLLMIYMLISWVTGLNACQVIFENDCSLPVSVFDIDAQNIQRVRPGATILANQNPNAHAHLRITFGGPTSYKIYRLNQIACSKSHSIPVSATSILQRSIDQTVLNLEQEK